VVRVGVQGGEKSFKIVSLILLREWEHCRNTEGKEDPERKETSHAL